MTHLCLTEWETLLTLHLITWDSDVLPAMDRKQTRTRQNCSNIYMNDLIDYKLENKAKGQS